ncbi:hypothetical protein [Neorhodopirellula pilleata]|uniref:Secreted protein n=1 Tax=Neorhodopirellula pilleata TaxID=2714738 RepID=A0A5C6A4E4_9BACT|nr:hypothetical protein [Neorhodopirellula pilleata]TWT94237.1 hypothetical protein Pla100_38470 [Neorhodopirellula pilleata]
MSRLIMIVGIALLLAPAMGCGGGNSVPDQDELSDFLGEHGDQTTPEEELAETDGF